MPSWMSYGRSSGFRKKKIVVALPATLVRQGLVTMLDAVGDVCVVAHTGGMQDAAALVRYFGQPRLDVAEGDMRKLQFAGEACVLDVFLYPLRPGAEPVATGTAASGAPTEATASSTLPSKPRHSRCTGGLKCW